MKNILLKISLLLNLGLLGGLVGLCLNGSQPVAHRASPMPALPPPVPENFSTVIPVPVAVEDKPFHWSQLDAKDYHGYVKNLRAIGCPEPALRAIVTADVQAAFRQYDRELKQQLACLHEASWTNQLANADFAQRLENRLQQLPGEEAGKIDDYLSLPPATAPVGTMLASAGSPPTDGGNMSEGGNSPNASLTALPDANPTTADTLTPTATATRPVAGRRWTPALPPVAWPMVFQPVSPTANLTPGQTQVINDVRQQFVDTISQTSQNPSDPAYQQAWQQAQAQADGLTEAQLGWNAYINLWINQYQASLASQAAAQ